MGSSTTAQRILENTMKNVGRQKLNLEQTVRGMVEHSRTKQKKITNNASE